MSSQGLITILLSVIGVLIISWVGIASMWVKDRFSNHEEILDKHDDRITGLEINRIQEAEHREEMLSLLKGLSNVG